MFTSVFVLWLSDASRLVLWTHEQVGRANDNIVSYTLTIEEALVTSSVEAY